MIGIDIKLAAQEKKKKGREGVLESKWKTKEKQRLQSKTSPAVKDDVKEVDVAIVDETDSDNEFDPPVKNQQEPEHVNDQISTKNLIKNTGTAADRLEKSQRIKKNPSEHLKIQKIVGNETL